MIWILTAIVFVGTSLSYYFSVPEEEDGDNSLPVLRVGSVQDLPELDHDGSLQRRASAGDR